MKFNYDGEVCISDEKIKEEVLNGVRTAAYNEILSTVRGLPHGLTTEWHELVQEAIIEGYERAFNTWFSKNQDELVKAIASSLVDNSLFSLKLIKHIERTARENSTADTPQTDWEKEKSEKSLCNSCGKDCDNRKRNLYTVECNRYEPQTDCGWK